MDVKNVARGAVFDSRRSSIKREEVDAFVQKAASQIDELIAENAELKEKINVLAFKVSEYQKEEQSIGEVIVKAQKLAGSIINEAKEKASLVEQEAISAANEVTRKAKQQAENIVTNIKGKTVRELETIRQHISRERDILDHTRQQAQEFQQNLFAMYTNQLQALKSMYSNRQPIQSNDVDQPEEMVTTNTSKTSPIEKSEDTVDDCDLVNDDGFENTADLEAFIDNDGTKDSDSHDYHDNGETKEFDR